MISRLGYRGLDALMRAFNRWRGLRLDPKVSQAEQYYAVMYRTFLSRAIPELIDGSRSLQVLDVGCGSGRFLIELAGSGHRVTGLDYMKDALDMARAQAQKAGIDLDLRQGDALAILSKLKSASQDVVLSFEALYVIAAFRDVMAEMVRVLKPGGFIACSHRPKFYFITSLLRKGDTKAALKVARADEGIISLKSLPVYYNWQTRGQLEALYTQLGTEVRGLYPIGMFSGIGADGMSAIAGPENLDAAQLSDLLELECQEFDEYATTSRYTLVIARKPL